MLCRVVVDAAEPAWWLPRSWTMAWWKTSTAATWKTSPRPCSRRRLPAPASLGFQPLRHVADWARPHSAKARLRSSKRIQGYLIEASEDTFDNVLELRDEFLRALG